MDRGWLRGFTNDIVANNDDVLRRKGGNYGVYQDLLRDDQVRSTWQQRRLSVTQAEWKVEPGATDGPSKSAAKFLEDTLKAIQWDSITDKMLYTVFYGHGVAEMMWGSDGQRVTIEDIKVRDRARFLYDIDGGLWLADNAIDPIKMPDRKFWTASTGSDHSDNPYGLGLAHSLYWLVFFKRNDVQMWLTALEKFGSPTAVGKAPAGKLADADYRDRLHKMLAGFHTDATMVLPDDAQVELIEAFRKGTADYQGLQRAMDAAISKVTVGQTMTTDPGSSRAQAEVHMEVRNDITKADAGLMNETFMQGPVRWLTEWNFPGATPPLVYRETEPEEDLNTRAERDQKIFGLGYEPTEEYIKETYGDGWQKKQAPDLTAFPGTGNPADANNPQQAPGGAPQAFAEMVDLISHRQGRRTDQEAMKTAATRFASNYEGALGQRVAQLVQYAEHTGDLQEFEVKLRELLAEDPPAELVQKFERSGVFARLMGAMRQTRS